MHVAVAHHSSSVCMESGVEILHGVTTERVRCTVNTGTGLRLGFVRSGKHGAPSQPGLLGLLYFLVSNIELITVHQLELDYHSARMASLDSRVARLSAYLTVIGMRACRIYHGLTCADRIHPVTIMG